MLSVRLERIVRDLLARTEPGVAISIDALGDAIGLEAVSGADIDAMISVIESKGHRVVAREGARGEANLRIVVTTLRSIASERAGSTPTIAEISERSGLSFDDVKHALALARVMQNR